MPMQYVEKWRKPGYHSDSIDCLSFSPDGSLLASGGMDGNIVFSDSTTGAKHHVIRCRTPVLSLKWVSTRPRELWSGLQNGKLLRVFVGQERLEASCFSVHKHPVEHLSFDHSGAFLATAAHCELKVWEYLSVERLRHLHDIPIPRTAPAAATPDDPIVITSIHWLRFGKDAGCLLATYLYHGIICWDPHTRESRWTMPLGTMIGHAALHPAETSIAIMNQRTGIDVWRVPSAIHEYSFQVEIRKGVLLPVIWIDKGSRVLTGSEVGEVRIWNLSTGKSLRPLHHPGQIIRAIAAFYDESRHVFRVATGNAESEESIIQVFEAVELRDDRINETHRFPFMFLNPVLCLVALVSILAAVAAGGILLRSYDASRSDVLRVLLGGANPLG